MTVESAQDDRELVERGWSALPAEYRIPEQRPTLEEARAYCQRLATTHYENFHVASWFLPARLRPHFYSIYAYCRIADDLGDEVGNREQSLALLDLWGRELDACYRGEARHPVFVALAETIRACDIPQKPFADLLVAFRQDQNVMRYQTMDDVLDYCRYSANPVGRLVLYACGYRAQEMFLLSDFTCTALQLANFWQDVSSDYARGRIYLPLEDMQRYGVDEATIARREPTPAFRELLRYEVDYARELFDQGLPLIAHGRSGAGARSGFVQPRGSGDSARHRAPAIRRAQHASGDLKEQKAGATARALSAASWCPGLQGEGRDRGGSSGIRGLPGHCAQESEKFLLRICRPAGRASGTRFALCTPSCARRMISPMMSPFPSRTAASRWIAGSGTGIRRRPARAPAIRSSSRCWMRNAALLSLRSCWINWYKAQPRISNQGSAAYATFADLYRYCYLVASVVGLVCIRIFGYLDPRAEKLAEETGIAFQLTNILRDVREDAQRGRLYLPLEDLDRCGVAANSISGISSGRQLTPQQRQVLAIQAERAGQFYKSAEALLPLISPDSRAAMWVLVTIYHRLLRHIEQRNFDVFSARIGVPAYEKLSILGCGLFKTLAQGVWA